MNGAEYFTPQSPDGSITRVRRDDDGQLLLTVRFDLPRAFLETIRGREEEVCFVCRSRLARLGMDIEPLGKLEFDGRFATLEARIRLLVSSYAIEDKLELIELIGLPVGRLVFCPRENRLSAKAVYDELTRRRLQLPAAFSISGTGAITVQPHRLVYSLARELTPDDLVSIIARRDGRSMLNRLQVAQTVENIVVPPKDGVITSCTMFLHEHYVVLDTKPRTSGQHFHAVALDPVTTRGSRIFLEFYNPTSNPIINPYAQAYVYEAFRHGGPSRVTVPEVPRTELEAESAPGPSYEATMRIYETLRANAPERPSYLDRLVAISEDFERSLQTGEVASSWLTSQTEPPTSIWAYTARGEKGLLSREPRLFATSHLADLAPGTRATVLLEYFPNFIEHHHICAAALEDKVDRVVFRYASFEHGSFLSARDHGRLSDYEGLGLEVLWCNDMRKHVARHVYRGRRGFFVEPKDVSRFMSALIFAFYGSANLLDADQRSELAGLIDALRDLFGHNMAIVTGGGPGAMQDAAELGQERGLLTGAHYLETADQDTVQTTHFYQTFQDNSRHYRQRWFDVASFEVFCIGGLGTLEEVGMSLTDMKLGRRELGPIVFFGSGPDGPYWSRLVDQLHAIEERRRGPVWLKSNVLLTASPDEVRSFYRRVLELG